MSNNIRDLIGQRVIDITQNDEDDEQAFVQFMFENGECIKFVIDSCERADD